jgi:hypothetical protein
MMMVSISAAGGTETLTISGLPGCSCGGSAPRDLIGAFQLSGVNAARTTGATFGNNSEILMTNSTSTTVQYGSHRIQVLAAPAP